MADLAALLAQHGAAGLAAQARLAVRHRLEVRAARCLAAALCIDAPLDLRGYARAGGGDVAVEAVAAFPL